MPYRIQLRHDNAAAWTAADPTLFEGEIGIETDTDKIKIGDGVTTWTSLGYFGGTPSGAAGGDLSGTYPNPVVDGIQNRAVAATAPTDGQVLTWDNAGSTWKPAAPQGGSSLAVTAHNKTGSQIDKGKIVYIDGSHGSAEISIALADADTEATSSHTIGMAAANIATGSSGLVQVYGYLSGFTTNTAAFPATEGDPFYLSSTAGDATPTIPTQPKHGVRIGFLVKRAGGGAGSVFIAPQNYQELEELSDVLVSGLAEQDLLSWDNTTGVWKNRTVANALPNDSVTYSKIQNVSATDRILGRQSAGSGDIEEITCTAAGRALLDDADASAQRTTLGLGTLATQSGTFSGTSSGTNTGDQTITLTGDVTGSGTGSFAATIANDAVTFAKMQNISTDRLIGRSAAGSGDPQEITCTAAGRAILDDADAAAQRATLSAAPNGASYLVTQPTVELSSATDLGSLATGLLKSTSTLGVASISIATGTDLPSHVHSAADITSGTLGIARGGTGQTTAVAAFDALAPTTTTGDVIYYNGTDNVRLGIGAAGQVLTVNSGASAPEWSTASNGSAPDFLLINAGIL